MKTATNIEQTVNQETMNERLDENRIFLGTGNIFRTGSHGFFHGHKESVAELKEAQERKKEEE